MNDFQLTIKTHASPAEALKRISQVNLWWAKHFKGSAEKVGDAFSVHFGETFVDFAISDLVPGKRVVWHVTDCNLHWQQDKKEWKGTDVIYELIPGNGDLAIHFTHLGLRPEVECYENCREGWTDNVAGSLVSLLETGVGTPQ